MYKIWLLRKDNAMSRVQLKEAGGTYEGVGKNGDRIGNFGGADVDMVFQSSKAERKEYILDVIAKSKGHGGFAFGTGNSIPSYVPTEGYLNMIEIIREYRGDFK